jgi:hypothetical protein
MFASQLSARSHLYALSDNSTKQIGMNVSYQDAHPEACLLPELQRKRALAAGDSIAALTPNASLAPSVLLVAHNVVLVVNAAAACPISGPRSLRAHHLQPNAQLVLTTSLRSLELASLQPRCRDNLQRVQLLCCSSPLSVLALPLARAVNRRDSSRGASSTW